jgi:hypothetical protein
MSGENFFKESNFNDSMSLSIFNAQESVLPKRAPTDQSILPDYVTRAAPAEMISERDEAKGTLIFCLELVLPQLLGRPVLSHENSTSLVGRASCG